MILKSFSKVNLSLNVNKKLNNGLHNIQSYFCLVNLFDEIKIRKIKGYKDSLKFQGDFLSSIKLKNNSIYKTLKILRKNKIISHYYSIIVKKRIPVYSGLGGGTSNAAAIFKYFIKNNNNNSDDNKNILNTLESKVGSDLKLFFYNQGFLKDIKNIISLKRKYKIYFLLVYPNIKCSTKHIYSQVKKLSLKSKYNSQKINSKKKFMGLMCNQNNDLQLIVEKNYPIIKKLIKEISLTKGCSFSRMTGSGSVCYGLYQSERSAKAAVRKIKIKYPKFWLSVTKTI